MGATPYFCPIQWNETYLFIYGSELPCPLCMVQERTVIKTIVIRRVALSMTCRGQHCHFVPVDGITAEEVFHLVGNLFRCAICAPCINQLAEHGIWATFVLFAETSKYWQLCICHTHIFFICLSKTSTIQWFKFSCGWSSKDFTQYWQMKPRQTVWELI